MEYTIVQKWETVGILNLAQALDTISLKDQVKLFKRLSPVAREELIRSINRPEDLLDYISEEEVFVTVKELGDENAVGLLTYTNPSQLQYVVDLEFWKKDMLNTQSVTRWLEIIHRLGPEKIRQFVETADPELIVSIIGLFVKVSIRNPDLDLTEELDYLPNFTLDDIFFVDFVESQSEEAMRNFLETVFYWDDRYYFELMHQLAAGTNLENEELALKWRRSRLADKGFPSFEESLEIYQYLARNIVVFPENLTHPHRHDIPTHNRPVLDYPLRLIASNTLFQRSLDEIIDPIEKDRISTELAHVANKIMVADGKDAGLLEDLHSSLKKVSGYINVALEETCDEDVRLASGIIASNHMETLFRRGFSLVLDLRRQVHQLLRKCEGGIDNLGYPLAGLVRGLLQKRPVFASNLLGDNGPRDFQYLRDIDCIRQLLDDSFRDDSWEPL